MKIRHRFEQWTGLPLGHNRPPKNEYYIVFDTKEEAQEIIELLEILKLQSRNEAIKKQLGSVKRLETRETCDKCKWWSEGTESHRHCQNKRINSGDMISGLAVDEYELEGTMKSEGVLTWELFGCVLFEPENPA